MYYTGYAIQTPKYWRKWILFHVYKVNVSMHPYSSVHVVGVYFGESHIRIFLLPRILLKDPTTLHSLELVEFRCIRILFGRNLDHPVKFSSPKPSLPFSLSFQSFVWALHITYMQCDPFGHG
jgi:hypothetical protein